MKKRYFPKQKGAAIQEKFCMATPFYQYLTMCRDFTF